jgi:hypothetical protein
LVIVYSPISCAMACDSNGSRETLRYGPECLCEGSWKLSDNEDASPNKVNLLRPRYAKLPTANFPKLGKPAIDVEEINTSTHQVGRGGWRERASKEQLMYQGSPTHSSLSWVDKQQRQQGNHNLCSLWIRQSERPIGMMTQGNACRVKGPYRYCVYRTGRSSA